MITGLVVALVVLPLTAYADRYIDPQDYDPSISSTDGVWALLLVGAFFAWAWYKSSEKANATISALHDEIADLRISVRQEREAMAALAVDLEVTAKLWKAQRAEVARAHACWRAWRERSSTDQELAAALERLFGS